MNSASPRWVTRNDAAAYLQVDPKTVDRYVREGKLTKYTLAGGRAVRFDQSDLDAMLHPEIKVSDEDLDELLIQRTWLSEHTCWAGIIQRTCNPNSTNWKDYGGRGIDVDPRWRASFRTFLQEVGLKPSPELTLDRIDNDRGYWPDNVRWATASEQALNRRAPRRRLPDSESNPPAA